MSCLTSPVACLLSQISFLPSSVSHLLSLVILLVYHIFCQPTPVSFLHLLSPMCCLPSSVFLLLSQVSCLCLLSHASFSTHPFPRLLFHVLCPMSHLSCLTSPAHIFSLKSPVSQISRFLSVSTADLVHTNVGDLAVFWSKLAELGNLAVLMRIKTHFF